LDHVERVLPVLEDAVGDRESPLVVAIEELAESCPVSLLRALDQSQVPSPLFARTDVGHCWEIGQSR
jgi:hypothetical protein